MQIVDNAFNAALTGLRDGQQRLDRAAGEIAGTPAVPRQDLPAPAAARPPDLDAALLAERLAQYQMQAAAKVVGSADQALGSLIDMHA